MIGIVCNAGKCSFLNSDESITVTPWFGGCTAFDRIGPTGNQTPVDGEGSKCIKTTAQELLQVYNLPRRVLSWTHAVTPFDCARS